MKMKWAKYSCNETSVTKYRIKEKHPRFTRLNMDYGNYHYLYANWSFNESTGIFTLLDAVYYAYQLVHGKMYYKHDEISTSTTEEDPTNMLRTIVDYSNKEDGNTYYTVHGDNENNFYSESYIDIIYTRGSFIQNVTAPENTFPVNGRHADGYWYVLLGKATNLTANIDGIVKEIEWETSINGIIKPLETSFNVNGIIKT